MKTSPDVALAGTGEPAGPEGETGIQVVFHDRMASFLRKIRPLLQDWTRLAQPSVSPARLAQLLSEIRMPLQEAQASGAFANVWTVAGLKRNELRNAAVLAWLLDPRGTHALGDMFARALCVRMRGAPRWLCSPTDLSDISVVTEECPLGSTENRVDISITGPTFLVFIEVKIDASEGNRQLERYLEEAELKAASFDKRDTSVVLLTRDGKPTSVNGVASLGWRDVEHAVMTTLRALPKLDGRKGLLEQFALHVRSF